MKFSTYLKKIERKRSLTKKIVIYGIYALTPLVLFVSAFSNDRIITKCEDIKRNCAEQAALSNTTEQDEEIELLREENRVLKSANQGSSNELAGDLIQANKRVAQLTKDNRELNDRIQELSPAPGTRSIDDYIRENKDLNQQITDLNNNRGNEESVYEKRYYTVLGQIDTLKYELGECQNSVRNTVPRTKYDDDISKLEKELSAARQSNTNTQRGNNTTSNGITKPPIADFTVTSSVISRGLQKRLTQNGNTQILTNLPYAGDVVIRVCINRSGNVLETFIMKNESTTDNTDLVRMAENNAKKWKFSSIITSTLPVQCGKIRYRFTGG